MRAGKPLHLVEVANPTRGAGPRELTTPHYTLLACPGPEDSLGDEETGEAVLLREVLEQVDHLGLD
jgi:hypothetical protein